MGGEELTRHVLGGATVKVRDRLLQVNNRDIQKKTSGE